MNGKRYLVRLMSYGNELRRVETDDLEEARREYRQMGPPGYSCSPSLRVKGKELSWDDEMKLMDLDHVGDSVTAAIVRKRKAKPPPQKKRKKPEPFARMKKQNGKQSVFINASAAGLMIGVSHARVEVDEGTIRIVPDRDGNRLTNLSSGKEICATEALKGIEVPGKKRFLVKPLKGGGIVFEFREE